MKRTLRNVLLTTTLGALMASQGAATARACPNCKEAVSLGSEETAQCSQRLQLEHRLHDRRAFLDDGDGGPGDRPCGAAQLRSRTCDRDRPSTVGRVPVAEPTGRGIGRQVVDHVRARPARRLPASRSPEPLAVGRASVGPRDPPRTIDQGPEAILIEGRRRRPGRSRPATRSRARGTGRRGVRPQLGELAGIGRADDGADQAIARRGSIRLGPLPEPARPHAGRGACRRRQGPGTPRRRGCWSGPGRRRPCAPGRRHGRTA